MSGVYAGDFRKEVRKVAFKPMKKHTHYFRIRNDVEKAIQEKRIRRTDAYYVRQFLDRDSAMDELHVVRALEALHEVGLFKQHYKYLKGRHRAVRHFAEKIQGKIDASNEQEEEPSALETIRERRREEAAQRDDERTGKPLAQPRPQESHIVSLAEKKPAGVGQRLSQISGNRLSILPNRATQSISREVSSSLRGKLSSPSLPVQRTPKLTPLKSVRVVDLKKFSSYKLPPKKAA